MAYVQAVDAVAAEVDQLVAGVFDARFGAGGQVVLVFRQQLDDGRPSELPQRNTMRWICDFPRNGMMPQEMGAGNARRFSRLAETVEVVVAEEQLG